MRNVNFYKNTVTTALKNEAKRRSKVKTTCNDARCLEIVGKQNKGRAATMEVFLFNL